MANDEVTATIRVNRGDVTVGEGQHLHYLITVEGARPVFNLTCKHKTHFAADTLGEISQEYDVVWPSSSGDDTSEDGEDYTFSMAFIGALKYTVKVVLHDASHEPVGQKAVVLDADYESENPELAYHQGWVVHTPKG